MLRFIWYLILTRFSWMKKEVYYKPDLKSESKERIMMFEFRKQSDDKFKPFHHFTKLEGKIQYDGEYIYKGTTTIEYIATMRDGLNKTNTREFDLAMDLAMMIHAEVMTIEKENFWGGFKYSKANHAFVKTLEFKEVRLDE